VKAACIRWIVYIAAQRLDRLPISTFERLPQPLVQVWVTSALAGKDADANDEESHEAGLLTLYLEYTPL